MQVDAETVARGQDTCCIQNVETLNHKHSQNITKPYQQQFSTPYKVSVVNFGMVFYREHGQQVGIILDTTLYEDSMIRIHFRQNNNPVLLVTANNLGTLGDAIPYWGQKVIDKCETDCLSFMAKMPHWFPEKLLEPALRAAINICTAYKYRIGFGSSMGAYFLLKYGSRLNLSSALCFSPQYSIQPEIVDNFDLRFKKYYISNISTGESIQKIDLPENPIILFDPYFIQDAGHVNLLRRLGHLSMQFVPLPSVEHMTISTIADSNIFAKIINLVVSQPIEVAAELHRILSRRRRYSIDWHLMVAARANRLGRLQFALCVLRQALQMSPSDLRVKISLAHSLIAANNISEAMNQLTLLEAEGLSENWRVKDLKNALQK